MKSRKVDPSRRDVLKMLAAATGAVGISRISPVKNLINGMVNGIVHKANAQASGDSTPPRNFVGMYMASGVSRWFLDSVHNPYNASLPQNANIQVSNTFSNGQLSYTKQAFNVGGKTVYLPPIWASDLPVTGGGTVPMSSLLQNMLCIRGVNMQADGHPGNKAKVFLPSSSAASYNGAVADASTKPIGAVYTQSANSQLPFQADSGIGASYAANYTDPLGSLLSPFKPTTHSSAFLSRRDAMDMAMKMALDQLGQVATSSNPAAQALFRSRTSAETLLKSSLGDLSGSYTSAQARYQSLVRRAIDTTKSGVGVNNITNSRIDPSNFPAAFRQIDNGTTSTASYTDVRNMLTPTSNIQNVANDFAILEYMLVNGYSSSVVGTIGNLSNMLIDDTTTNMTSLNPDEHFNGVLVAMVYNTARFRAFYACLYEFIQVLKSKNMWEETVFLWGSEFNRYPRTDGSGADHGWQGNIQTVFSGAIDGPYFIGDTMDSASIKGSWGYGDLTSIDGKLEQLTLGYVASTVAQLLRVPTPFDNNHSLVLEKNGGGLELAGVNLGKTNSY